MRFLVYGYFEGVLLNFFHFFWFHLNPGTKIYKISNLQLGMCLLTHFMAKTVLRKEFTRSEFYGFWPIWRSEYQYFPLFLVPFESWHKNLQNIQITAWNVPPNSFYGQNRTSKRVYKKGIHGFWTIWRGVYNFFCFLGPIWSLAQKSTKYHNSSRAITCMPLVVLISTRTVYVIKNNRTISIVISFLKTCQENE